MRILTTLDDIDKTRKIVSVGSYDGVHLGHRLLISKLNDEADKRGLEPLVLTFNPHPKFALGKINRYLSSMEEQLCLLEEAGARNVLVMPFTQNLRMMSYSSFMKEILEAKLNVVAYVLGTDHLFGHDREGSAVNICQEGIEAVSVSLLENIGSTEIRELIAEGDIESANKLLGGEGYLIKSPVTDPGKLLPPPDRLYEALVNGKTMMVDVKSLPSGNIRLIK